MVWKTCSRAGAVVLAAVLAVGMQAGAITLKDVCEVQGARGNNLNGVGLVVGLAGTGDKSGDAVKRQERMLDRLDIEVETTGDLSSDNVAVVMVTATVPPFAREGTRIDVLASSIYDAESLEGGTLMETYLYGGGGENRRVYAVAQGPISVGGFAAQAGGGAASVTQNHVTAGRVPNGAYIEREIPSTITDGERINLLLRNPDFTMADTIRQAIDGMFGDGTALAFGAGSVNVTIPPDKRGDLVAFIAELQRIDVDSGPPPAKVVVNEKTGTIVVGGDVMVKPCQIAHGDLTITVAATPVVSQPAPLSQGETVTGEVAAVGVQEEEARLMPVEGTSASEVATALNKLKVTPRDMIAIFQALSKAGALEAELEIM